MKKGLIIGAFILLFVLVVCFFFLGNKEGKEISNGSNKGSSVSENVNIEEEIVTTQEEVFWRFNREIDEWEVIKGTAPECKEPLIFPSPVDLSLASSILYPGQIRGGDYKPHGGARFDDLSNNEVNVYAPMDGNLFKVSRHVQSVTEVQYALYFVDDCGIMYKFDHLRELTSKFENILDEKNVPMNGEGDTRTVEISPSIFVEKGELVATKVGIEKDKNIFFDFGVYDLRKKNGVVYDEEFRAQQPNIDEYGAYALCWLDYLNEEDKVIAKALPGGDGNSGKTSDYC